MINSRVADGSRTVALCSVVILALALGSCREEEQDRPLTYEKGQYQGSPDESLTPEQQRTLQERGNAQKF